MISDFPAAAPEIPPAAKPKRLYASLYFQVLIGIINEAQERDAEDERRLYHPMRGDRPSFFQRRRPDRR